MRQRLSHSLRLVVLAGAGALIFAGGSSAGPGSAPRRDSSTILVKFKIGNGQAQVAAAGDRVVGQTKTRVLIVEVHGRTVDQARMGYAASILPVKVLDSAGNGSYASIANGIIWAADHGARVINLSLSGSAYAKTMCDAVTYAISAGAFVVAAAGNDSTFTNEYPAA